MKLRLQIEDLAVESFVTAAGGERPGTVHGHDNSHLSCRESCFATGCDTCDNSLDYCTCQCTFDCGPMPTRDTPDSCPCNQEP